MKNRIFVLGTMLVAALPLWAGSAKEPRKLVALDRLEPGAVVERVQVAPAAGDPREWYFVVVKGPDPDFAAIGATLEAAWKNRRLVRVPPQAVKGLARHPDVLYLQRTERPGAPGQASATSNFEATAEAMPGPVSATSEIGNLTWTTGEYKYDGAGNVKFIGPDHWGNTQEYRYDGVGRLISATAHTKLENHTESFEYDVYGNLTSKQTDGNEGLWVKPNPATNQLTGTNGTSGGRYDEAGNLIVLGSSDYRWDGGGMLNEMWYGTTGQNGYVYTPDDERIGVVTSAGVPYWTWTIRDFGGKVVREFESPAREGWAEPWFWVEDYAHGLGRVLVSEREAANGGRRHYHADHLGTTRLVTTDDGFPGVTAGDGYYISEHVYYPFGIEATPLMQEHAQGNDRETRLKYTGHERDYLGGELVENTNQLDYMHARYYNPNLGRFLSVDPGNDWDPAQPQSWNAYAYVRNNPINGTDPTGRWLDTLVDIGSLAYGLYDMWTTTLTGRPVTWQQNAAVAADAGAIFVPGVTGLGSTIRAANKVDNVVDVVKGSNIVADGARGRASEARVLDSMGLSKNTEKVTTTSGKAIPDAQDATRVIEVKDTKKACDTCQMKVEREHAAATGREHVVVTGTNTKVSGPLEKNSKIIRRDDLGPP